MKKVIIAAAVVLVTGVATAKEGFYMGIGGGYNDVDNDTSTLNADLVADLGGSATSSASSSVENFRILAGYKFNENFAVELGYINTSKYKLTMSGITGSSQSYSGTGTVKFDGFDISVVMRPSISSGLNQFFAVLGTHNYEATVTTSVTVGNIVANETDKLSGTGSMYGVGYDWQLSEDTDMRFSIMRVSKMGGESSVDTTNIGVGLIKRF